MPLCRSPLTLRLALFSRSRTAAVEIPRFILHRRRSEFLPDGVPGGFSVRLVRPTAKGAYAPGEVIISMPRRGARTHSGGKAAVGRVRVCESKPPPALAVPRRFSRRFPHFYALFPPPCISYHTKMQIYDDILCPASFFCGGAADRRTPNANHRPPTADRRP